MLGPLKDPCTTRDDYRDASRSGTYRETEKPTKIWRDVKKHRERVRLFFPSCVLARAAEMKLQ